MYYVMDAHSFYNFIYFILLIIVSIRESSGPWTIALGLGGGEGGEEWAVPREPSGLGEPGRQEAARGVGNPSPRRGYFKGSQAAGD